MGGLSVASSHYCHTHKTFLFCNYTLLGAATSCVFLTLSLRLLPSPCGLLLIALHALTAVAAAGEVILKMVGSLGLAIFCLEWVALALAFALRYHAHIESGDPARRSSKVGGEEELKNWPWPFQV
ncbi:hypothetical protein GW17_00059895 [Ensete ventricosum]|nr:hypothetical protein GW17_00059895 [Ensete ventricosum]